MDASIEIMEQAEQLIQGQEFETISSQVLRLAATSGRSTYDCEFVALAQELDVPLVTADKLLIDKFKSVVISMEAFCS